MGLCDAVKALAVGQRAVWVASGAPDDWCGIQPVGWRAKAVVWRIQPVAVGAQPAVERIQPAGTAAVTEERVGS